MRKLVLALMLLAVLSGCASSNDLARKKMFESFDRAIGKMTYDNVLVEWGPPTSIAEGDNIFVAVWEEVFQPGGGGLMPIGRIIVPMPTVQHGTKRTLVFDKTSRLLQSWKFDEK